MATADERDALAEQLETAKKDALGGNLDVRQGDDGQSAEAGSELQSMHERHAAQAAELEQALKQLAQTQVQHTSTRDRKSCHKVDSDTCSEVGRLQCSISVRS